MHADRTEAVTQALADWNRGDRDAVNRLMPLVYPELRSLAERQMRRERPDHTLQPTAVVHELFLLLLKQRQVSAETRAQFLAFAGHLMRRILVDHARARHADKRGGASPGLEVDSSVLGLSYATDVVQVLEVDTALQRLATLDPDQARIVELRFFAGLSIEEIAELMDCSSRTVKREWRLAKAWLFRELCPS